MTDHPRNVPDDVLAPLPANGGVCMVTFVPRFVSGAVADWDTRLADAMDGAGLDHRDLEQSATGSPPTGTDPEPPVATIDDVVAHLDHVREAAGVDHVGIGGDYDGVADLPAGLEDVSGYPRAVRRAARPRVVRRGPRRG